MSDLDKVLAHIDGDLDAALARLFAVLRIKSISTDPAYAEECRKNAEWHAADLRSIGFETTVHATPGHPIVLGHDRSAGGFSALFYGHYDVQPVDPLELWTDDPFDPKIKTLDDGTKIITGRGSADDKGQLMTFVEACRAWRAVTGKLPIAVSILLEGEEETGGANLPPFMTAHRDELKADIGLICDTNMWNPTTPAIQSMLRGMVTEEFVIHGADRDLHSGFYGMAAANPNRIVAKILADLYDSDGRVTLKGFYDGVPELPESLKKQWDTLGFTTEGFLGPIGLSVPAGEKGRSALEQVWSRPTAEINGMGGGYQGEGFKTVIPAKASAKVSFRLVFEQDPDAVRAAFREHVTARVPADCKVEFIAYGAGRAIRFPNEAPAYAKSATALTAEWRQEAKFIGGGGSIPVTSDYKNILGMDVMLAGFGLDDDRIHSPNEKYNLRSFQKGIRSWARILDALSR